MSSAPKHTRRWLQFGAGTMLVVVTVVAGCAPNFGGDAEQTHLTYEAFRSRYAQADLDPRGASDICRRQHSTPDGYDIWLRMSVHPADFDTLRDSFAAKLQEPQIASYKGKQVGPVRRVDDHSVALPVNWPKPDATPPSWWTLSASDPGCDRTYWELQVDDTPYDGRAKGWYWLYDRDASVMWIWEWNHQHFDLGWMRGKVAEEPVEK